MFVHRSNRAEALVDVLAEVVSGPPVEPLGRECVVVQGRGMERWLAMQLARRLGVWANPDFPFPRRIIERALASVLDEAEDASRDLFTPEAMMWSVAALLPAHLHRPELVPIRTYLAGDDRGAKLVQLAERIADTFDHYAVYRPEMVLDWERGGGGDDWQPVLWRALVDRHGRHHIAARAERFVAALAGGARPAADFPRRLSLFGVSTLPPLYLDMLVALARVVELHLFVLSPSREYWAEIRSRREQIRRRAHAAAAENEEALHIEEGHPLLASLGRLGRDFHELLEERADYLEGDRDLYREPGTDNMLAALQSDMLHLRTRGPGKDAAPLVHSAGDDSIAVHACHGPMRELEVLHDQLLALFEEDPTLEPHDVVVMAPSIEAYAPFIEAVFGERGGGRRIPARVADRSVGRSEEGFEALLQALTVLSGRFTAPEVLDLLGNDFVRSRFGIAAEELERVRRWVTEAGVRWAADAEHRAEREQPRFVENTWRFGLDRLLLGYAMPGSERALFGGVLPYDDLEGTSADLLGRLAEFLATLNRFRIPLGEARTLEEWRHLLSELLEALLGGGDRGAELKRKVRLALGALADRACRAGFSAAVGLATVRRQLEREVERGAPARGFLSGGVTFCELVPMRSIPFRVVCLVGMDDESFPRTRYPLGFDLIAARPRRGDRSPRDDDRYLFLEALLSARERLLITYVGQSIHDDGERPPSVIVSELLDVLAESWHVDGPEKGSVRDRVVLRHPLQPFSPRYFRASSEPRLFSFAESYCDGARRLVRPSIDPPPFVAARLPAQADPGRVAPLDDFVRFFDNPSRFFVQRRLGLFLEGDLEPVAEREPMQLDALEQWQIGDRLLARLLGGDDPKNAYEVVRASGALPLGTLGRVRYETIAAEASAVAAAAAVLRAGDRLPPLEIEREIDGVRLIGLIRDLWPVGQVRVGFSRTGRRSEIRLWIHHLLLNASDTGPRASFLIGRGNKDAPASRVRFRPVGAPLPILKQLLDLYRLGQTLPLLFFPESSRAYAQAFLRRRDGHAALTAARKQFDPKDFPSEVPSEGEDVFVRQIYGRGNPLVDPPSWTLPSNGEPPLMPQFAEIALAVFAPLFEHREEEEA